MELNKNMNVLVVDDQKMMRRIIITMLGELGVKNVQEAADGNEALDCLRTFKPDLILSDWNMEGMTGIDFLKAVRQNADFKTTPFIMVTGENKAENIVAAKQAGVSNYIVKPFAADVLKTKILSVMK